MPGASTRIKAPDGGNAAGITATLRTEGGARARRMATITVTSRIWMAPTAGVTRSARGSWVSKPELTQVVLSRVPPQAMHARGTSTGLPVLWSHGGNAGGTRAKPESADAKQRVNTAQKGTATVRRSAKVTCCQGSARTRARIRVKRARIYLGMCRWPFANTRLCQVRCREKDSLPLYLCTRIQCQELLPGW